MLRLEPQTQDEVLVMGSGGSLNSGDVSPTTPELRHADMCGNPNKIAQFFPELRIS